MTAAARVDGHLTQWNDERGFGFLTPLRGHDQTFVHISAFPPSPTRPRIGQVYSFSIEVSRGGKRQAVRLQPEGRGGPPGPNRRAGSRPAAGTRPAAGIRPAAGARRRRFRSGALSYLVLALVIAAGLIANGIWSIPIWVVGVYLVASVACFTAYAIDKRAAVAGNWRVAESTLHLLGFVGGWPGAIVAQQTLRHKTQKASFRRTFWVSVVMNVAIVAAFTTPLWTWLLAEVAGN